jgi:hypothetical protein
MISNFESIHNDREKRIINEHVDRLKVQIKQDQTTVNEHINTLTNDLLIKLDEYYDKLRNEAFSTDFSNYYDKLIEDMKAQLNEYETCLRSLASKGEERQRKSNQIKELIECLEIETVDHKKKIFKYKDLIYVPSTIEFGKLNVSLLIFLFLNLKNF